MFTVETYTLRFANGHKKQATQVVRNVDGKKIRFLDKMTKREALMQAAYQIARNGSDDSCWK